MPETPPLPAPKDIEVGTTPLYLKKPILMTVDHKQTPVTQLNLRGQRFDKDNLQEGPNNGIILLKNKNRGKDGPEFKILEKINDYEKVGWDDLYGILISEEGDKTYVVPKDELSLIPPSETPPAKTYVERKIDEVKQNIAERRARKKKTEPEVAPSAGHDAALHDDTGEEASASVPPTTPPTEAAAAAAPTPETPSSTPPSALTELQNRAQPRKPEVISVVGLNVRQSVSERAAKNVQEITLQSKDIFTKIWKGNIASELIREHQRQYVNQIKNEAHLMFSDETYALITQRAQERYDRDIKGKKGLGPTWTRFTDWVKSGVGGYTSKEQFAIDEVKNMYASGEIARIDSFEQSAEAIQQRYETNFLDSEGAIRANLGEHVETFKAGSQEHAMMMGTLTKIRADYLDGKFGADPVKADLELARQIDAFGQANIKGQNDLYTSSLTTLIKNDKALLRDDIDRTVLDAQFAKMDIRIGAAQMGESTQFQMSDTEKTLRWFADGNILGSVITNEATAGTITAIALTLGYLPRTGLSSAARFFGGAVGGGAVAGTIAGLRKNAEMKDAMYKYYRERERGGGLPQQGDKIREFFHAREIPQMDVNELITRYTDIAYENGQLKQLSEDELTKTLAYLADAKARRAVSARGGENISLIQWGPAVDVARTNLDLSINKLENDLLARYGDEKRFNGNSVTEWTKKLTASQRQVLEDGQMQAGAVNDPLKLALGVVSDSAPEIKVFRHKYLGVFGKEVEKGTSGKGLNANLRELKTAIRYEAVNHGVKAGVIGTAIGTGLSEVGHLVAQGAHNFAQVPGFVDQVGHLHTDVIPTHAVDISTLPHYTDLQGIDHMVQAQIPDHTNLIADAAHHSFNLVDAHGTVLQHGIQFDTTGEIVNADALNASHEAIIHGLHFNNLAGVHSLAGEGGAVPTGGFNVSAGEMAQAGGPNNGEWGWISHNIGASPEHFEHVQPAANLADKLFRFNVHDMQHNDAVGIDQQLEGYHRVVHYITNDQGDKFIDYQKMSDNLVFHNVPDVFRPEHVGIFGQQMDHAMALHDKIIQDMGLPTHGAGALGWKDMMAAMEKADPVNGHLDALIYKLGPADQPITEADFTELMHLLGGTPGGQFVTNTGIIDQTIGNSATIEMVLGGLPTPAVAPLPREGMKPGTQVTAPTPTPPPQPTPGYGYGYGQGYGGTGTRANLQQFIATPTEAERANQALPSLLSAAFTKYSVPQAQQQIVNGLTPPEQLAWLQNITSPPTPGATPTQQSGQSLDQLAASLNVNLPPLQPERRPTVNTATSQDLTLFIADETNSPVAESGRAEAIATANDFMSRADLTTAEQQGGLTKPESGSLYKDMLTWLATQNAVDLVSMDITIDAAIYVDVKKIAHNFLWDNDPVAEQQLTNAVARFIKQYGDKYHVRDKGDVDANLSVVFTAYDLTKNAQFKSGFVPPAEPLNSTIPVNPPTIITTPGAPEPAAPATPEPTQSKIVEPVVEITDKNRFVQSIQTMQDLAIKEVDAFRNLSSVARENQAYATDPREMAKTINDFIVTIPGLELSAEEQQNMSRGVNLDVRKERVHVFGKENATEGLVGLTITFPSPDNGNQTKIELVRMIDGKENNATMIFASDGTYVGGLKESLVPSKKIVATPEAIQSEAAPATSNIFTLTEQELGQIDQNPDQVRSLYQGILATDITTPEEYAYTRWILSHQIPLTILAGHPDITQLDTQIKQKFSAGKVAQIIVRATRGNSIDSRMRYTWNGDDITAEGIDEFGRVLPGKLRVSSLGTAQTHDTALGIIYTNIRESLANLKVERDQFVDTLRAAGTQYFYQLLDKNAGSLEISTEEAPRYIPAILSQLEKPLGLQPGELKTVITHDDSGWVITGATSNPEQGLALTLSPDPDNGFAADMKLAKFGGMAKLLEMGVKNPGLILGTLNGQLKHSEITKLSLQPDGTIVFTGKKK